MDYRDYNDNEILSYIYENNEEANEILYKKYEPLTTFFLQEQKKYYNAVKEMIRPDLLKQLYVITEEGKMIINDNITKIILFLTSISPFSRASSTVFLN